ncbi:hypothetical protein [Streptomyces wuyuanensis]|uniref:Uncharacterized protein n=1 Tax=Streptomyces wuyuanensis TaxID=1196353 RepID=A0A1H0B716_9ACTN|nr:hypothetical protein SAMN05444921_12686 [Streptomyces wuyuanensis]
MGQDQGRLERTDAAESAGPGNWRRRCPDLASTPAQKKAAANAIEKHLEPDTKKAGDTAEESTGAAVREFSGKDGHGWDTSPALKRAHEAWEKQVKALMGRLGSEKSALRNTSVLLRGTDVGIAVQTRQSSSLDKL